MEQRERTTETVPDGRETIKITVGVTETVPLPYLPEVFRRPVNKSKEGKTKGLWSTPKFNDWRTNAQKTNRKSRRFYNGEY